jgi:hypothetical protein
MKPVDVSFLHPKSTRWRSTSLRERKTGHRNGRTLKLALVDGRDNEQATSRKHLRGGLPKKPKPAGKLLDMLT